MPGQEGSRVSQPKVQAASDRGTRGAEGMERRMARRARRGGVNSLQEMPSDLPAPVRSGILPLSLTSAPGTRSGQADNPG